MERVPHIWVGLSISGRYAITARAAQWDNRLKDLRTELYQILYEAPIYPKNLYLERAPMKHAEYREEVILKQIARMQSRGIWAK